MQDDPIRHIFFPYADDRSRAVADSHRRFVYYTTAETAFRILKNREIWMRNTATMNDYLEVEHGFECLNAAYKSESGKLFRQAVDTHYPDLTNEVVTDFNSWLPGLRGETYITCVSEHLDSEDQNGRLSMWRAYGGNAGIALVLKPAVMFLENDSLGISANPVAYFSQSDVELEFQRIAARVRENATEVLALGRERASMILLNMFRSAALCTKHPGFSEELEWRVVANPLMFRSSVLTQSVEVIHGIPQIVQKINLTNRPEDGLLGLELSEILDRVIIGPCAYSDVVRKALYQLLVACNVAEPEHRLYMSDIPLRSTT